MFVDIISALKKSTIFSCSDWKSWFFTCSVKCFTCKILAFIFAFGHDKERPNCKLYTCICIYTACCTGRILRKWSCNFCVAFTSYGLIELCVFIELSLECLQVWTSWPLVELFRTFDLFFIVQKSPNPPWNVSPWNPDESISGFLFFMSQKSPKPLLKVSP